MMIIPLSIKCIYTDACKIDVAVIFITPNIVATRRLAYNDSINPLRSECITEPPPTDIPGLTQDSIQYIIMNTNIPISHIKKKLRNDVFLIHSNRPVFSFI